MLPVNIDYTVFEREMSNRFSLLRHMGIKVINTGNLVYMDVEKPFDFSKLDIFTDENAEKRERAIVNDIIQELRGVEDE